MISNKKFNSFYLFSKIKKKNSIYKDLEESTKMFNIQINQFSADFLITT